MATSFGLGPIREDDELLDRLAARECADDPGLEGVFAAWTRAIDADERAAAATVGPLGLRLGQEGSAHTRRGVRVVKVRRARAVAVLGALTLTISGGGVAAALNNVEFQPVAAFAAALAPSQAASTPTPTDTTARKAWQVTAEQAKSVASSGEVERARGMLDVMRKHSQTDVVLAGEVAALEQQINQDINETAKPAPASAAFADEPTTGGTTPATIAAAPAASDVSRTLPSATAPPPAYAATSPSGVPMGSAGAGTATVPPATVADSTTSHTTTPNSATGTTTRNPTGSSAASSAPSRPSPAPSSVGSASGNQAAGQNTAPSSGKADSTTRPSDGLSTRPQAAKPSVTKPAPAKPTAAKPAPAKPTATKPAASKTGQLSEKSKDSNVPSVPATRRAPSTLSTQPPSATS